MEMKNIQQHTDMGAHPHKRGFALLVAVIFMSVMLAFALTLGSVGYKQGVLSSSAVGSQYAFYAADAALECALYADYKAAPPLVPNPFTDVGTNKLKCNNAEWNVTVTSKVIGSRTYSYSEARLTPDADVDSKRELCADIVVYKPTDGTGKTWIFSQGYDVSCDSLNGSGRYSSRGIKFSYN